MSIWIYNDWYRNQDGIDLLARAEACVFCRKSLRHLMKGLADKPTWEFDKRIVRVCDSCGWWTVESYVTLEYIGCFRCAIQGAVGQLKQLDLGDQANPIDEIRTYLMAKYAERFSLDPWKYEEVVASVYADFGYTPRVTARTNDGGVDIMLDGPDDILIGVQVKRYKDKIGVDQIRSLTGALYLEGMTRGIFVTTSSFTKGAMKAAEQSAFRGVPIELVEATRFYEALDLAQTNRYQDATDPEAPFSKAELLYLSYIEEFYGTG